MSGLRRLVVFGCSWTTGFQWTKPQVSVRTENGSKWSGKSSGGLPEHEWNTPFCDYLKRNLAIEVLNLGKTGSSNLSIMNDFLHYLKFSRMPGDIILVAWTDPNRCTSMNGWEKLPEGMVSEHIHRFTGIRADETFRHKDSQNTKRRIDPLDCSTDYHFKIMASTCAYRTIKSFCEQFDLPYRMINSFSDQTLLDKHYDVSVSDNKMKIRSVDIIPMMEKDNPNWIEGQHKYNTLMDICVGNWLSDQKHKPLSFNYMNEIQHNWERYPMMTRCMHPNEKGNERIAEVLLPYIKEMI